MPAPADYRSVVERIADLKEKHPEATLQPANPLEPFRVVTIGDKTFVAYAAACYRHPDDPRPGIGVAWEPVPGPTNFTRDSELQNAETSAWGRAIVAALASESKNVASSDEIRNRPETAAAERPSCAVCGEALTGQAVKKTDAGYVHEACLKAA